MNAFLRGEKKEGETERALGGAKMLEITFDGLAPQGTDNPRPCGPAFRVKYYKVIQIEHAYKNSVDVFL